MTEFSLEVIEPASLAKNGLVLKMLVDAIESLEFNAVSNVGKTSLDLSSG
jgi:hypothetical protein